MEEEKRKAYKKEWCKYWLSQGSCRHGPACSYAHGKNELLKNRGNYKTELCKFRGDKGECNNGDNCSFAHNEKEIRKIPFFNDPNPLYQKIESNGQPKLNICKYWLEQGQCKKLDSECLFAHGTKQLENARNQGPMPTGAMMGPGPMMFQKPIMPEMSRDIVPMHRQIFDPNEPRPMKQKPCKNWEETKSCPFENRCKFSHGNNTFKNDSGRRFQKPNRPMGEFNGDFQERKIKTRMCMYFEKTGNCQRGDSCTFAHSEEELRH